MDGNINQNNCLKMKKTTLNCIQIILLVFKMDAGKLKYIRSDFLKVFEPWINLLSQAQKQG